MFKNIDRPLQVIQHSIAQSFPGDPEKILNGGRLLISKPFIIKDGELDLAIGEKAHRYYVKVFIRGHRRPYTIDIKAIEQKRTKHGFKDADFSDWIAKGMAKIIHLRLNESREQKNIIDDFRPF